LDDGNEIDRTLASHCAIWHKSCRDSFNKTKLNRILKAEEGGHVFVQRAKCSNHFVGQKPAAEGDLREACTIDIDSCIRFVARELGDFDLISKPSAGDMIVPGAKYHANCLASLYNRAPEHDKEKSSEKNSQAMAHSITLAELFLD